VTRIEVEEVLVAMLRAAVPGAAVESLPEGEEEQRARLRKAAVWVTYSSGVFSEPRAHFVQPGTWQWSIAVFSKSYRSAKERGDGALELLQAVEDAVVGEEIGGRTVQGIRDAAVPFFAELGVMGYELIVQIDREVRKV
jgi:hypothetical protein